MIAEKAIKLLVGIFSFGDLLRSMTFSGGGGFLQQRGKFDLGCDLPGYSRRVHPLHFLAREVVAYEI